MKHSYWRPAILVIVAAGLVSGAAYWWIKNSVSPSSSHQVTEHEVRDKLSSMPLVFQHNDGQLDKQVSYFVDSGTNSIFFTPQSVVYTFQESRPRESGANEPEKDQREPTGRILAVKQTFNNANSVATVQGKDELGGKVNYLIGNDPSKWHRGIPTYKAIEYRGLYDGTVLTYSGAEGSLKYEFRLNAGVSPDPIQVAFDGIVGLSLAESGDLVIETELGTFGVKKPSAYQMVNGQKKDVEIGYTLIGSKAYGFTLGDYDHALPLVIDPRIFYGTYLGGSLEEEAHGIAIDASGNAYVTGWTTSTNWPGVTGFYDSSHNGSRDVFVSKLNTTATSSLIFSTYIGGSALDQGFGIALDSTDRPIIVGTTTSTNYPTTVGAFATSALSSGQNDVIFSKLSSDGTSLVFSSYFGGSSTDSAYSIAVDTATDDFCIVGDTTSTEADANPFPLISAYDATTNGAGDAFFACINNDGASLNFSSFLGGTGVDSAQAVAMDSSGKLAITGSTTSTDFPLASSVQGSLVGSTDAFVTQISAAGTLSFSTYLGGTGADVGYGVTTNTTLGIAVTGSTASANFPTSNALDTTLGGSSDGFIARFDTGHSLVFSTYFGGASTETLYAAAADNSYIYVIGVTASSDYPATAEAFRNTLSGSQDIVFSKINYAGNTIDFSSYYRSTTFGATGLDIGYALAVDGLANIYGVGETASTSGIATTGVIQPSYRGGVSDGVVFKASTANVAPSVPTLEMPQNGDYVISTTPNLAARYTDVDNNDTGFINFRVSTGTTTDCTNNIGVVANGISSFSTLNNQIVAGPVGPALTDGVTYAWCAQADDGSLTSAWTPMGTFTVQIAGSDVLFSTYLGGTGSDSAEDVTVDAAGNVYVVGQTSGTDFPTTAGVVGQSASTPTDGTVTKFDTNGNLLFSTYVGGDSDDEVWGVRVDGSNNIYLIGLTYSSDLSLPNGYDTTVDTSSGDGFIIKLDSTASNVLYGTAVGGSDFDFLISMALRNSTVYAAGNAYSTDLSVTPGAFQTSGDGVGNGDSMLVIVDTSLSGAASHLYETYISGDDYEEADAIDVDASGNAYVLSSTYSTDIPTTAGAYDTTYDGGADAALTIIAPNGAGASDLVYGTRIGSNDGADTEGDGIYVQSPSQIHIVGATQGSGFSATAGALDTSFNGGIDDGYYVLLNPGGNGSYDVLYATYIGTELQDNATQIVVQSATRVIIGGRVVGTTGFPLSATPWDATKASNDSDGYLMILNPAGTGSSDLIYSTYIGTTTYSENVSGLALDSSGDLFMADETQDPGFPVSTNAYDTTQANINGFDMVVMKWDFSKYAYTPPAGVPNAVTDLAAQSSDTQVVLSWSDPGGATVVDYVVEYGATSGFPANATVFAEGTSAAPYAVVTGLTNETSYSFRVYAVSGVGTSLASNLVTSTPNTTTWVLDTANTAPYPIVGTAIVKTPGGKVEFYGPGATDSKGLTIYDPAALAGSRWTASTIFSVDLNWPRAYLASNGFAYLVGHQFSTSNLTTFKITLNGGPAVQQTTSPIHRDELGAAFYNDEIYIFGGADAGTVYSDVFKYNTLTDTWTTGLAPLPTTVRRQAAAEAINGLIYVAGGDTTEGSGGGSATLLSRLDIYNPATDSWASGAAMPAKRAESCTTVYDGKMYVFSGKGDTAVRQEVLRYDPAYNEWSKASSLTKQRKRCGATTLGTTMYVFGGHPQGTTFTVLNDDFDTTDVSNGAPYKPTHLFVADTDAQVGGSNPTGITSGTPHFSAICNDPNWSDTLTQYRVEVDDNADFASPVWDSGAAGTAMTTCRQGTRSADIVFGGTPLATDGTTYYWRIKYWDNDGAEGSFSETVSTASFSMASGNAAPTAPSNLFAHDTNAQAGSTNPTGITSSTPVFSAICNDPNAGDILNKYRIQVDDTSNFSSLVWDSGAAGTAMANCTAGARSANITFGGTPLAADGTLYYWRIKFWDDDNTEGSFSAGTDTFTMATASNPGSSIQRIQSTQTLVAPQITSATATGPDRVQYEWTYTGSAPLGFKILDADGNVLLTIADPLARYAEESGLSHNTAISGRTVVAYNSSIQSERSSAFPTVHTWMIPVSAELISRVEDRIRVGVRETLNDLTEGQSAVQFQLIPSTDVTEKAILTSDWQTNSAYTFKDTDPSVAYSVRVRTRNYDGVVSDWSAALAVRADKVENPVELLVDLTVRDSRNRQISGSVDANEILHVYLQVLNNGALSAHNVLLTLPIAPYLTYVQGSLVIDGVRQTEAPDRDPGQVSEDTVAAVWPTLDSLIGHTVQLQMAFDTPQLLKDFGDSAPEQVTREPLRSPQLTREDLFKLLQVTSEDSGTNRSEAGAASSPLIALQALASDDSSSDPVYSNEILLEPNLTSFLVPEPQVPPPTEEEVTLIHEVLQPSGPSSIQQGTTQTVTNNQGFESVTQSPSGTQSLILQGQAMVANDQIVFSGKTSEPFTLVTVTINGTITQIVTSDALGEWQTFVSAEDLGLSPGQQKVVSVQAVAAKGDLRSDTIDVGSVTISRSSSGALSPVISGNSMVRSIDRASQAIASQEPAIQTTLAVAAPVILASSLPLWGYLPYLPTLLYHLVTYFIGLIGRRKKSQQRFFGIVYDSISKQPLALAIVRVYAKDSNKLVTTLVSDKQGRYEALLEPGSYRLEVIKPAYTFPSQIVDAHIDGNYQHVYDSHSGLAVQREELVIPDVPVDPVNAQRTWEISHGLKKLWLALQSVGNYLAVPALVIGAIMSLLVVMAVPQNGLNWVLSGMYIVMLAAQLSLHQHIQKAWGVVYDIASNAVLPLTTIQLIDPSYGKVVTSRLTDYEGRYSFLPQPGHYVVKASKPGYEQVKEIVEAPKGHDVVPEEITISKPDERITGDVPMKQAS